MSLIVYYQPLPPNEGARVPLDLHDPRIRRFLVHKDRIDVEIGAWTVISSGLGTTEISNSSSLDELRDLGVAVYSLIATLDGRWVESRVIRAREEAAEGHQEGQRYFCRRIVFEEEYREVNAYFAAFVLKHLVGDCPYDLEPYLDFDKMPARRFGPDADGTGFVIPLAYAPIEPTLKLAARPRALEGPTELPDLVTLDQAAAAVHRKKRALEHYKANGRLPAPTVKGGGGKPALWDWKVIRSWLEAQFAIRLPESYFANRGR